MTTENSLPTRKLGKNGPQVTAQGFGAMGLSFGYGPANSDEERFKVLDHVYESGVRFWDSSDIYGDNEDLLGKWFKRNPGKRENIFLATKFAAFIDPNTQERKLSNDPEYIRKAINKSLSRLGLDFVDLYYCHRIDSKQPIEVTVGAMKELQQQGKVKYLGLSECSAETLRRACTVAHIDAVQIEYSPFSMDIESPEIGLLKMCRDLGVATVAYSPLGRGFVTGSIKSRDDFGKDDFRIGLPRFSEENFPKNLKLVDTLTEIAKKKGCTSGQLTLAFLTAQGNDIIPIPGTTKIKNFDENVGALKVELTSDELKTIRSAIENAEVHGGRYPEAFTSSLFADTVPQSQ